MQSILMSWAGCEDANRKVLHLHHSGWLHEGIFLTIKPLQHALFAIPATIQCKKKKNAQNFIVEP